MSSLHLCPARERAQIFEEIKEDELDFHTYCARKQTLRSYIALLRFEDSSMRRFRYFGRAALLAARVHPIAIRNL